MNYNTEKINLALKDKRLNHLKKAYAKLDKILTPSQRAIIKKKIKHTTPNGFSELLIAYFLKYNITYETASVRVRTPEDKEDVSKRQSAYIARQKEKGDKKIQVYISEYEYKLLLKMKETTKKTFGEIIGSSIQSKYMRTPTWSK